MTLPCTSACVPITRSIEPSSIPSEIRSRSLPVTDPVNIAKRTVGSAVGGIDPSKSDRCGSAVPREGPAGAATPPIGRNRSATERACCPASTSVGAMIAA